MREKERGGRELIEESWESVVTWQKSEQIPVCPGRIKDIDNGTRPKTEQFTVILCQFPANKLKLCTIFKNAIIKIYN